MKLELKNFKSWRNSTFEFGDNDCTLISGPSGQGKCFAKNTMIRLANGTSRAVQDIRIGDEVFGWDSTAREVLSVTSGEEEMYKITAISPTGKNVMDYTVNKSHTLTVITSVDNEPIDLNVSDSIEAIRAGLYLKGFRSIAEYPSFEIDFNPYIYGVILQGGLRNISLNLKRLMNRDLKPEYGYYFDENGTLTSLRFRSMRGRFKSINSFHRNVHNLAHAQILSVYCYNSVEIRKNFLAGLVDRHGSITSDGEIYLFVKDELVNTIIDIVHSIGGYVYYKESHLFIGLTSYIPTRLLRPYIFQKGYTISITPVGFGEYYGFMIEGDGRFCLADYTVTHNSSILQGIEFALFGTGKNLVSHGETSCSAKFSIGDTVITRTKRPNRLVLCTQNSELEDDSAQAWISRRFSAKSSITPFITMTPADKLVFLENAAFRNIDISKLKELAKLKVKGIELSLAKAQQNVITLETILDDTPHPENPPDGYNDLVVKDVRTIEKRLKNGQVMVTKIRRSIDHYQKLLETTTEARNEIAILEKSRINIQTELEELEEVDLSSIRIALSQANERLNVSEHINNMIIVKQRIEQLETEKLELESDLESQTALYTEKITAGNNSVPLLDSMVSELDKLETYAKLCDQLTELENAVSEKESTEQLLESIPARRQALLDMETVHVSCPCCNVSLRYRDGNLFVPSTNDTETSDTIESLKKLEKQLTRKLAKIDESSSRLHELTAKIEALEAELISEETEIKYIEKVAELERIISLGKNAEKDLDIYRARIDTSLKANRKTYNDLTKKFSNLDDIVCNNAEDPEEIKREIQKLNQELHSGIETTTYRRSKLQELERIETRLSNIEIPENTDQYTEKIQKLKNDLPEYEEKVAKYSADLEIIRKYAEYQRIYDEYTKRYDAVSAARSELINKESAYTTAVAFRQKIIDSESETLASIINTLNSYAADYLNAFFPENPIIVEILPYKETAKRGGSTRKSQITTRVEYRGAETDITSLSSGERDRVILAFSLAVNQLQNGQIVMLDECTSSLDAETSNVVFSKIRENLNDRCVLIVAHQIVQGIFDDVLEI
jgi:DNA repair exonuclease SbcCD ATPase subunit